MNKNLHLIKLIKCAINYWLQKHTEWVSLNAFFNTIRNLFYSWTVTNIQLYMSPAHYSNAHIYSSCTVFCGHREGVSEMDRGWKSKLVDNVLENARSSDWQQFNFHCNFPLKLRLRLEPSSPGCMTSVLLCPASNWSPLFPGAEKERSNTLPNRTELAHTHTGGHARSVAGPLAPDFDFTLYLTMQIVVAIVAWLCFRPMIGRPMSVNSSFDSHGSHNPNFPRDSSFESR